MPRFRPRISILTSMLLITIASMAIVIVQLWRNVGPLQAEVRNLRRELGYLSIDDPSKIYAIEVPARDDGRRYRIYLPKNRPFQLHSRIHTIPGRSTQQTREEWFKKLPGAGGSVDVDNGEFTIDVDVRPDVQKPGHWNLVYRTHGGGGGTVGSTMPWLNDRRAWLISGEPSTRRQIERDPSDGLVIFVLRKGIIQETSGGYSLTSPDESKESEGVMLWIAPASDAN